MYFSYVPSIIFSFFNRPLFSQSSFQIDPNSILFNRVFSHNAEVPLDATDQGSFGVLAHAPASAGADAVHDRLAKFRQNVARFRLYRHRFLQVNMRFAAFFKIYQII